MDGKYGNFGSGTASLHRQRRQTTKAEPLRNLVHCVVLSVLCTQKLQLLYVQYSQISGGGGEGPASHARTPPKCQMPNAKCPALRDRVLPQWRRVEVETRHPALALGVGHWTLHHCVQRTVVALEAAQRTGNSLTLTARQTDSLAKRGFLHGRLPASNLELYQRRTVTARLRLAYSRCHDESKKKARAVSTRPCSSNLNPRILAFSTQPQHFPARSSGRAAPHTLPGFHFID